MTKKAAETSAAFPKKKREMRSEGCCASDQKAARLPQRRADVEVNEQDIVDYLQILAAKTGTQLEVISGSAEHGNMLASLGKVGAILRYNPGHTK